MGCWIGVAGMIINNHLVGGLEIHPPGLRNIRLTGAFHAGNGWVAGWVAGMIINNHLVGGLEMPSILNCPRNIGNNHPN